jgi:hypothetical protein
MSWDDTKGALSTVPYTEWNDMTSFIKGVIANTTTATSGSIMSVTRDLALANTDAAVAIFTQDNDGDDKNVVEIVQDGDGACLKTTLNGSTTAASIVAFDDEQGSNTNYVQLATGGTTRRRTIYAYRNLGSGQTNDAVATITQDEPGDDTEALIVIQDGSGTAVYVEHNDTTSTNHGVEITRDSGNELTQLVRRRDNANGSNLFYRDLGDADTNGPVVKVWQTNTGDTEHTLEIENDGTGSCLALTQNGNNNAAEFLQSGEGSCLFLNQDGNDYALEIDNDGDDDSLYINTSSSSANSINIYHAADADGIKITNYSEQSGNALLTLLDASSAKDFAAINFGTQSPSSPSDGDLWFDGSNLKLRVGGTTYTLTKS